MLSAEILSEIKQLSLLDKLTLIGFLAKDIREEILKFSASEQQADSVDSSIQDAETANLVNQIFEEDANLMKRLKS
ncbi:MAG: hypothetical protein AAGI23_09955 [Bacteroidota bacterium]